MNWTIPIGFGLFLIGAAAVLAQLWLSVLDPQTFITLGVLLAVDIAWHVVARERTETRRTRDLNKLD